MTVSPFQYVPYGANCLPTNTFINYQINEQPNTTTNTDEEQSDTKRRKIIVTQNNLESDHDLTSIAQELVSYLIEINESRVVVDFKEVESLIEEDFLSLDDNLIESDF